MMKQFVESALWGGAALIVISIRFAMGPAIWHLRGNIAINFPDALPESAGARRGVDTSPIVALAPFGQIVAFAPPEDSATETGLDIVLKGVMIGSPRENSWAAISSGNEEAKRYFAGNAITDNVILEAIELNRILLRVNGQLETLSFPQPEGRSQGVQNIRAGTSASSRNAGPHKAVDAAAVIDLYRQRITSNPTTLLDELGVAPSETGYIIGDSPSVGVSRAGLKPGDRVVRVNGAAVGNVETDRQLFEDVVAVGRARVEIVRDERVIVFTFPLR